MWQINNGGVSYSIILVFRFVCLLTFEPFCELMFSLGFYGRVFYNYSLGLIFSDQSLFLRLGFLYGFFGYPLSILSSSLHESLTRWLLITSAISILFLLFCRYFSSAILLGLLFRKENRNTYQF